eukprot:CAMPEP_0203920040 /NCGR_PEP_ID=MMETSP0359-20131031/60378_1 /ASSEMBLY_ACC=CAM_ASM_000338 /TAXON_ID=268821 /ORGANISM="Scrippsiella Hangoei, Strain SHTV-5" /LENGTH=492 /DNA_ID=CAMNT_0050847447 /DNA_START=1 /DNA_END=1476 /DNA_ORIENTATION=+
MMPWCILALLLACADGLHVQVPVSLPGLGYKNWLHWVTERETAEEVAEQTSRTSAAYFATHGHDPAAAIGVTLHVSLDGETPALHGVGRLQLQEAEGPGLWVPWEDLPVRLHMLLAMLAPETAIMTEEAPFKHQNHSKTSVGMFVLLSPGRLSWRMLCWSLRVATLREMLVPSSMHVLVHSLEDWRPRQWLDQLGVAAPVLRGFHWCKGPNRYPQFNPELFEKKPRDNYYNKVFMMLGLARRHNYRYIVSIDDDVLMPPWTLARLVASGPEADDVGCGVVSPLLQNGVPSTELWAEAWLEPDEREYLYGCYSGSSKKFCNLFLSSYCDEATVRADVEVQQLHAQLERLQVPFPWDATAWYRSIANAVDSDMRGLHPVRGNETCMEVVLAMALERVEERWDRAPAPTPLLVDRGRTFRYFCNNVYLVRADLYSEVIHDPGLKNGGADEVTLSRLLASRRLPVCHLAQSFGVHPAYSTHPRFGAMEGLAVAAVE